MKIYCCRNCMEKNRSKIKSDKDYFNSLLKYKTFEAEKEYFVGFGLENKVKDGKCIFCNSPVELLNIEDGELAKISHFGSPNPDYVLAMNKLKGDDIISFTSKYKKSNEFSATTVRATKYKPSTLSTLRFHTNHHRSTWILIILWFPWLK